jgi:hypothetical protein
VDQPEEDYIVSTVDSFLLCFKDLLWGAECLGVILKLIDENQEHFSTESFVLLFEDFSIDFHGVRGLHDSSLGFIELGQVVTKSFKGLVFILDRL